MLQINIFLNIFNSLFSAPILSVSLVTRMASNL